MHERVSDDVFAVERRLERSVASVLRLIEAAQAERQAAPVRNARLRLRRIYGETRLARAKERLVKERLATG